MIDPAYARLMAEYNAEMNRRFLASAWRLGDEQRREQRGAFWGSIHATFNHILWADRMWLYRFTGSAQPHGTRADSDAFCEEFSELAALREQTDAEILDWSENVTDEWLAAPCRWFRETPNEFSTERSLQVVHMFNHQTHHRGQIHALLTAFGEDTAETDLWIMRARQAGAENSA
jgi:uncharacterized damage-inducible protein DinB